MKTFFLKSAVLIIGLSVHVTAYAQPVAEPVNNPAAWSQPYPPFRIAGNLYYVGTYDLACYLITTSKGSILINTGLAASADIIKNNIEALGFAFADIKILLTTQAHFDHMGAFALIKKLTGASLLIDEKDAAVAAEGGRSDYALGSDTSSYAPVIADRLLTNGDTITLGDMQMVMLHHPGHTRGSCSYLFDVKDVSRTYRVLIANLPTIVTRNNFNDIPAYPDIKKDYAYTIDAMKKLRFDIWLSSHASQFALHRKRKQGDAYRPEVFIDRQGYDKSINELEKQFLMKVKEK